MANTQTIKQKAKMIHLHEFNSEHLIFPFPSMHHMANLHQLISKLMTIYAQFRNGNNVQFSFLTLILFA